MAKSKEELIYDIENNLVDPDTNKITGVRVKERLLDMVDAMGTGGGGGGASQMQYYTSEDPLVLKSIAVLMPLIKCTAYGEVMIGPGGVLVNMADNISAVAFDGNVRMYIEGEFYTYYEFLLQSGWDDSYFVQITEEEFYTI